MCWYTLSLLSSLSNKGTLLLVPCCYTFTWTVMPCSWTCTRQCHPVLMMYSGSVTVAVFVLRQFALLLFCFYSGIYTLFVFWPWLVALIIFLFKPVTPCFMLLFRHCVWKPHDVMGQVRIDLIIFLDSF